jgi:squalene-associated FAD-dependent desaturase
VRAGSDRAPPPRCSATNVRMRARAIDVARATVNVETQRGRPTRSEQADVVIAGGGLAGLACAFGLRTSGLRVVVCEASASLGGRARSWIDRVSGDSVDLGPHVVLSEYSNFRSLLEQLGTHHHLVWQTDRLIRIVQPESEAQKSVDLHVRPLSPPLHLLPSLARVRAVSMRDKLSNASLMWLALRLDERDFLALDRVTAWDLLQAYGVTPRFRDWFWASVCMSLMNVPLTECSAGALLRVYAQLIGHRDYRFGFADCGLADLFVPAAIRAIRASGGEVHLHAKVVALLQRDGRAAGVILEDGTRISSSQCVMALTPAALEEVLPARYRARAPFSSVSAFKPSPYISVYLWLDRKLGRDKFWARAWSESTLNYDFYDLSNIRGGWSERPSVVASNIIFSHRAEEMSDEEIVAATHRELCMAQPAARGAKILHSSVHRIPMAIPCPLPGTEQQRPVARTPIPGLLLAGDWTRTELPSCMESAVRSGWLAAEEIWSSIGRPCRLALAPRPPEGLAGLVQRWAHRRRGVGRASEQALEPV